MAPILKNNEYDPVLEKEATRVNKDTGIHIRFFVLKSQPAHAPPVFIHKAISRSAAILFTDIFFSPEAYRKWRELFPETELLQISLNALAVHEFEESKGASHRQARLAQAKVAGYGSIKRYY